MINTNVYNYLVQSYVPKSNTRYDLHKRSELRSIYSTIVKKNKQSPLYKVTLSEDKQQFALNLKDSALSLKSSLAAVNEQNPASVFYSQKAYSAQPDKASAEIVSEDDSQLPDAFTIKVNTLASTQLNQGASVYKDSRGPVSGSYSFLTRIGDSSYEFQFNINPNTVSNNEVLTKLSDFINKSGIGITAGLVREPASDKVHLELESQKTGRKSSAQFELEDLTSPSGSNGIVAHYGLGMVKRHSANAQFEINQELQESTSNHFMLGQSLRLDLLETSSSPFQIAYQPDSDRILAHVEQIASTYNSLIGLADSNLANQRFAGKLAQELKNISSLYKNELEASGITLDQRGAMSIDKSLASQAAGEGDLQKLFGGSDGLAGRLSAKMSMISIDPMEYIDKKLVTYPDTSHPGTFSPYVISIYSGMLFNYYC